MAEGNLNIALTCDILDDVANAKGVANYVRFLSNNLAELNSSHKFTTVHYTNSNLEAYPHKLRDIVINPVPFPGAGLKKLITNLHKGQNILSEFDIVHATAPQLYYFPLLASNDYKTVMTVHAMDLYIPEEMKASLMKEPHAWVQQTLLNTYFERIRDDINAIITVSKFLKDELVQHKNVPPEKIYPVHLAPDEHFRITEDDSERSFILSDTPEPELIEMFQRIRDAGIDRELVIFSMRGYGYKKARQLVDKYGLHDVVEFRGYVPDEELVNLYNSAGVYVRFAGYEGFGLPPIEAMACGCPVVTTDVCSLPEVVGDAGILIPYNDIDRFVDAVSEILMNDKRWDELHTRGLNRASQFSWKQTAKETVQVYQEIADK